MKKLFTAIAIGTMMMTAGAVSTFAAGTGTIAKYTNQFVIVNCVVLVTIVVTGII